jgi:hypothetical protein
MSLRLAIASVLTVSLVSCARVGSSPQPGAGAALSSSTTASPRPGYDQIITNWSNPIDGEPVTSIAAAQSNLPFTVYEPKGLPTPTSIVASPTSVPADARAIVFIYQTTPYGWLDIVEHVPPEATANEYDAAHKALLALNGQPTTYGTFKLVPLPDGQQALLTVSDDGAHATVFWLQGDAELVLEGPTLSPDQALNILPTV